MRQRPLGEWRPLFYESKKQAEELFLRAKIPIGTWGTGRAKSLDDLLAEAESRYCIIEINNKNEIRRSFRVAKIKFIRGSQVLIETHEQFNGGPLKPTWQLASGKIRFGEEPREVAYRIAKEELEIDHPKISNHSAVHHETKFAPSYPGLSGMCEYFTFEADGFDLPEEDFRTGDFKTTYYWKWFSIHDWAQMAAEKRSKLEKGDITSLDAPVELDENLQQAVKVYGVAESTNLNPNELDFSSKSGPRRSPHFQSSASNVSERTKTESEDEGEDPMLTSKGEWTSIAAARESAESIKNAHVNAYTSKRYKNQLQSKAMTYCNTRWLMDRGKIAQIPIPPDKRKLLKQVFDIMDPLKTGNLPVKEILAAFPILGIAKNKRELLSVIQAIVGVKVSNPGSSSPVGHDGVNTSTTAAEEEEQHICTHLNFDGFSKLMLYSMENFKIQGGVTSLVMHAKSFSTRRTIAHMVFSTMENTNTGQLRIEDLKEALGHLGLEISEVEQMQMLKNNESDSLDFEDFLYIVTHLDRKTTELDATTLEQQSRISKSSGSLRTLLSGPARILT